MNALPMLDHISFAVSDLAQSIAFYDAVLAPLRFVRVWTATDAAGYGYPERDENFAPSTKVRRRFARSTAKTTSRASCVTPTVTASRPCVTWNRHGADRSAQSNRTAFAIK